MDLRTGRFARSDRVLHSRDYRRISRCGSRAASKSFVVLVAPMRVIATREYGRPQRRRRLGITVSRRVGNAVVRNRVKRRIREWFRHLEDEFASRPASGAEFARSAEPGREVVVIARHEAAALDGCSTALDLTRLLEQASKASQIRRKNEVLHSG